MTQKLTAILAGIGAIILFWYLAGAVFVLKGTDDTIEKLQCVSYAPFAKEQSPFDFDAGMQISEQQVREDLALLSHYTNCIRTYSTVGLEMIPAIVRENGMQMYMGAWISSDKVASSLEVATLIRLATTYRDVVKAVIVGNEVLLRNDTSDKVLTAYINEVKHALPNTPVTYADVWEYWLKYPDVREATDFVTIHILPYWEDDPMDIAHAIKHLQGVRENVETVLKDKNILIGETGWPSEGRMREDALPSKINQAIFVREFAKLAEEKGWHYNVIEAFDQPWKRVNEGAVGGFWGLFDKDRQDKHVFHGSVSNFPNYQTLLWGSVFFYLFFLVALRGFAAARRQVFIFSAVNALFAVLFMLQLEQYSITSRTLFEWLWAALVLAVHLGIATLVLLHIRNGTKPAIARLGEGVGRTLWTGDGVLMVLFYLSFVLVLLSNLALAFEGRYRNFEIYIFLISIGSFWWLYSRRFGELLLGTFEKASFVILVITSFVILWNETILNWYAVVWVFIALGFATMLYSGTQNVAYATLKPLALMLAGFFALFAVVRFGLLSSTTLLAQCNASSDAVLCDIRSALGLFVYLDGFGIMALVGLLLAWILRWRWSIFSALFLSVGALMMFNTLLGAIAFVGAIFLLSKDEKAVS